MGELNQLQHLYLYFLSRQIIDIVKYFWKHMETDKGILYKLKKGNDCD